MYVGLTNTINSLYCVKKMVFDRNNVTTLEVLRMALMNNWGEKYAIVVAKCPIWTVSTYGSVRQTLHMDIP